MADYAPDLDLDERSEFPSEDEPRMVMPVRAHSWLFTVLLAVFAGALVASGLLLS